MPEPTQFRQAKVTGHSDSGTRRTKTFEHGEYWLDDQGNLHLTTEQGEALYNWRYWISIKTDEEVDTLQADSNEDVISMF